MSLYQRQGSACWWFRFQIASREYRGSTRTRDRRAAAVEERRQRALREATAPDRRAGGSVDVAQLAEWDTARALAEGASDSRAQTLEWLWTPIAAHFGGRPVNQIDHQSLCDYVGTRRAGGVRGQTIRREVQALRRGLTIAKRRGILLAVLDAPRIRSDAPLESARGMLHPPAILAQWIAALPQDARDEVSLALRTGLRAAELKRIRPSWVEPAPDGAETQYLLRVPAAAAKTRTERIIGLTDSAAEIVRRRIEAEPTAEFVLAQAHHRTAYRSAARAIGYEGRIKLRDLRHTFATLALRGTGDPWAALESLGHRDLRTTSRYQHTTETRAAATAAAAEKLLDAGTAKPAQSPESGGRRGYRTHDPRLVRPDLARQRHVSTCIYCHAMVDEHMQLQADAPGCRHIEPAQLRAVRSGR